MPKISEEEMLARRESIGVLSQVYCQNPQRLI